MPTDRIEARRAVAEKSPGVATTALIELVAATLRTLGASAEDAILTARSIVAADCEGVASHGVMLVRMYVDRIRAGSVVPGAHAVVAHDGGSAVTLDAGNGLGQVSADQAVRLVIDRARTHGMATVAVRNAFHFGTAGYWARAIAQAGQVGIVLSNTRPLMPPPGGAERIVGNNPIAIAVPSADGLPIVTDMAMSATAMGKIRLAESAGRPIPEGWASDAEGRPTTDPATAIKGMLLPAAGPKGFGLAMLIDLLCGGLSGGAIGDEVQPLYGDPAKPYACAHLFMAIDLARFGVEQAMPGRVQKLADKVRHAKRATGTDTLYAPGDLERARASAAREQVAVPADVLDKLLACAQGVGLDATAWRARLQ